METSAAATKLPTSRNGRQPFSSLTTWGGVCIVVPMLVAVPRIVVVF